MLVAARGLVFISSHTIIIGRLWTEHSFNDCISSYLASSVEKSSFGGGRWPTHHPRNAPSVFFLPLVANSSSWAWTAQAWLTDQSDQTALGCVYALQRQAGLNIPICLLAVRVPFFRAADQIILTSLFSSPLSRDRKKNSLHMLCLVTNWYDRKILENASLSVVRINDSIQSVLHYYVNMFMVVWCSQAVTFVRTETRDKKLCSTRHVGQQQVTESTQQ